MMFPFSPSRLLSLAVLSSFAGPLVVTYLASLTSLVQAIDVPSSEKSTACADIFNSEYSLFPAKLAYDCLTSVPFNATVAIQFLQYYKDTLQFQSSLAYIKNPPSSYQQPAVDVLAGLDLIGKDVKAGVFKNEYAFEAAVQELIYATHDAHIALNAGALSVFTFGSPLRIASVSLDGIVPPKIYSTDDIIETQYEWVDWVPSAISTINGIDVTEFLSQYAALNAPGTLEPHADWNQLMSSAAGDVNGRLSAFEGSSPFYPGENITFAFENGTTHEPFPWLATYTIPEDTPLINSGEDFYAFFVLGYYPDVNTSEDTSSALPTAQATAASSYPSQDPTSDAAYATAAATTSSAAPMPTSWEYFPYPSNPDVVQPNLGLLDGGVVTGYFLNDGVTAVLSIPSFSVTGEAIRSFSSTIGEFLRRSKESGYKRIIIDVQKNGGGGALLATDTFKQFFPSIDPYGGNRLRAHPTANTLGNTFTNYYDHQRLNGSDYDVLSASVWVASDYINAGTERNFTSWAEFYGPHLYNGDYFTTTQRDNLSSIIYDESAGGIVVYGFANRSATSPQPYAAADVVILSDSFCHSACASFVEMMHHQAGVRTVVAGGRPVLGSMQVPSGSRGADAYSSFDLDDDIYFAETVNSSAAAALPDRDVDFEIAYAGFNLKDFVREGEDVPLQFKYEAADCRIFFTARTIYNYLNLWNYVVDAIWRNPSLCVEGSTNKISARHVGGFKDRRSARTKARRVTKRTAPTMTRKSSTPHPRDLSSSKADPDTSNLQTFKEDGLYYPDGQCDSSDPQSCPRNQKCVPISTCSAGQLRMRNECRVKCSNFPGECRDARLYCHTTGKSSGFCDFVQAAKDVKRCQTPTKAKPNPTAAAAKIPQLPYAAPPVYDKRPKYGSGAGLGSIVRAGFFR